MTSNQETANPVGRLVNNMGVSGYSPVPYNSGPMNGSDSNQYSPSANAISFQHATEKQLDFLKRNLKVFPIDDQFLMQLKQKNQEKVLSKQELQESETSLPDDLQNGSIPQPVVELIDKKIEAIVDSEGGISKSENVQLLIELMNDEKIPKNQTLCLNVLSRSCDAYKKKFVEDGGLNVLDLWLKRDVKKKNLMKAILNHLGGLPVTYDNLKISEIGKTIKSLTKNPIDQIKQLANEILKNWKSIVSEANAKKKRMNESTKDIQPKKVRKIEGSADSEKKTPQSSSSSFSTSNAFGGSKATLSGDQKTITRVKKEVRTSVVVLDSEDSKLPPKVTQKYEPTPISAEDFKKERLNKNKKTEAKSQNTPNSNLNSDNLLTDSQNSNKNFEISKSSPSSPPSLSNMSVGDRSAEGNLSPIKLNTSNSSLNTSQSSLNNSSNNISNNNAVKRKRVSWDANLISIKKIPPRVKNNTSNSNLVIQREAAQPRYLHLERMLKEWRDKLNNMHCDQTTYSQRLRLMPPLSFNMATGQDSKEAKIQAFRFNDIPPTKFTNHLPASPSEPTEITVDYDDSKVPIIPLNDIAESPQPVVNNSNNPINYLPLQNMSPPAIPTTQPNIANNLASIFNMNLSYNPLITNPALPTPQKPIFPNDLFYLLNNNQSMNTNIPNINLNNNLTQMGNVNLNNGIYNNSNINIDDKSICRFHFSPSGCKRGNACEYRHTHN